MDEHHNMYRMMALMNTQDLEAMNALKKAGSRSEYFTLLTNFTQVVPFLTASLVVPTGPQDLETLLKSLDDLQKWLFAVGAPGVLWQTEKVVGMVQAGQGAALKLSLRELINSLDALTANIRGAKMTPAEIAASNMGEGEAMDLSDMPLLQNTGLPKAPIKPEPFEKLSLLIENFEIDDALTTLQEMRAYSYNDAIDLRLASVDARLQRYDHAGASAETKQLLELVEASRPGSSSDGKKRILAIDDVPDVLSTIKLVLKEKYAVYGVTNHMAALKFLVNNSADLILLDIEMPDMDGITLLGIIRKIDAYKNTPVLFLTGSVSVENIKRSMDAGGNDFLRKPIEANVLMEKIDKHLA